MAIVTLQWNVVMSDEPPVRQEDACPMDADSEQQQPHSLN